MRATKEMIGKAWRECGAISNSPPDWALAFAQGIAEGLATQSVPEGFALVPLQPTQAMCQAGQEKAREWPRFPLRIAPIWQAMIAAAQGGKP